MLVCFFLKKKKNLFKAELTFSELFSYLLLVLLILYQRPSTSQFLSELKHKVKVGSKSSIGNLRERLYKIESCISGYFSIWENL